MRSSRIALEWVKEKAPQVLEKIKSMPADGLVIPLPSEAAGSHLMFMLMDPYGANGVSIWRMGRIHFKLEVSPEERGKIPFDMVAHRDDNGTGKWKLYITEKGKTMNDSDFKFMAWKTKWLPQNIIDMFRAQGDTSEKHSEEIDVICKFFNPTGAGTWWCYEYDEENEIMWCYANLIGPEYAELGTVSLRELATTKCRFNLSIERDFHFETTKLSKIIQKVEQSI